MTVSSGVLEVASIERATLQEAEALTSRLYATLPRICIADLLAEVAGWADCPNCFTRG